jgi:ubiquinone biosynthesis protein Coq4
LPFPGDPDGGDVTMAHHDFTHVVTGYTPTPPDEVALQAMLTAASNFDHHFSGLVGSLAALESATFELAGFVPREAVLDRPGAADKLADAFRRGSQCTGDIGAIDFWSRRDDLLVDVRAEYNIEPVNSTPARTV